MSIDSYYDVLSGLAALQRSQDVSFTAEELRQFTRGIYEKKPDGREKHDESKVPLRPVLHDLLGGTPDLQEAARAGCSLNHTLLGGYVPQSQLEALSGADFARYFHRVLECNNALETYNLFLAGTQAKAQVASGAVVQPKAAYVNAEGKLVKKAVVCRRCKSKFYGASRLHALEQHKCSKAL